MLLYLLILILPILHILDFNIIYQGNASFHTLFWFNKENIPELIQYNCKSDENLRFCKGVTLLILSKIKNSFKIDDFVQNPITSKVALFRKGKAHSRKFPHMSF